MNKSKNIVIGTLLTLLLLLTACGAINQAAPAAETTVDTAAIVEAVLAEVEAQQGQNQPAELDANQIAGQVMATLEAQPEATAETQIVPAVNVSAATLAADESLQNTLIDLYQHVNPAVVYILVPNVGSGSGFLYDDQGHIVTNRHVIAGADSVEVVFYNGERRDAEILGSDADGDLAVLQVQDVPAGIEPLPLAANGSAQVGEFVVAIGSPFGEQGSMTLGIISGLGRSLRSQRSTTGGSSYSLPQVIQTDAPINPGNSGGPLLNLNGEVVGVNAAIASTSGTGSGVGFSIPVEALHLIVPSLIENGEYQYPYLGVSFANEITLSMQEELGLPQATGAYVLDENAGGPADQAGVIAADAQTGRGGDLVIAIDGQTVNDFSDLNSYLVFETRAGQTITLTVLRDGEQVDLSLTLGARP